MSSIHATCIVVGKTGVLIRGASGSGKSSLALRMIDGEGFGLHEKILRTRLVADDQVVLRGKGKKLVASAPEKINGLIEIRGIGILPAKHKRKTRVKLVVDLGPAVSIPRLPEDAEGKIELEGIRLRRIFLDAASPSAASALRAAVSQLRPRKKS
ncbi:HPr kinase/phosphorylase [Aestuariivirga litoralis]|uniref:HPr kinase/phosphorylase n=1 Tax=Aestuariivirga litoralis TaxID=2650924 RepID=UPI0018C5E219|nr:HPr kinase/phosphatase C-terminal domain-containing protein [Aestuariivirga litoralis]MBG1233825.1 hypothetical protein [Aestuariivirga litoralis]